MSRQANRMRSLAAASDAATPAGAPATEQAPRPAAAPALNSKPVRTTVVLSPVEYDRLQGFCGRVQQETGRRGVATSEVIRVLLGFLEERSDLQANVQAVIEKQGGNRRR